MKIYVQTDIFDAEGALAEQRPPVLVLETTAPAGTVAKALAAIAERLGRIIAIPAAAHEGNLKAILPRDLAEHGIEVAREAEGDGGRVTLRVERRAAEREAHPQGEVGTLGYAVSTEA